MLGSSYKRQIFEVDIGKKEDTKVIKSLMLIKIVWIHKSRKGMGKKLKAKGIAYVE
jgi:hypothetical protein